MTCNFSCLDEDREAGHVRIDTLIAASTYAIYLRVLGDHQQARVLAENAFTRLRRILGEDHPDTLTTAGELAWHLNALGDYQQARLLNEDTLARLRGLAPPLGSAS